MYYLIISILYLEREKINCMLKDERSCLGSFDVNSSFVLFLYFFQDVVSCVFAQLLAGGFSYFSDKFLG